jgi:hypothetical protein
METQKIDTLRDGIPPSLPPLPVVAFMPLSESTSEPSMSSVAPVSKAHASAMAFTSSSSSDERQPSQPTAGWEHL